MPSSSRRALLARLGAAAGALAGCAALSGGNPPAGSLRFVNDDDLPHTIGVRVTDVGERPGEDSAAVEGSVTVAPDQRDLGATVSLPPGEARIYESVFTERAWYAVAFTLDGQEPPEGTGRTAYNPYPADADTGRVLRGEVSEAGAFSWGVASTDDLGSFGQG